MIFGDMIGFLESNKDKSKKMKGDGLLKNVGQYRNKLHLIDAWRIIDPSSRNCTFYSDKHKRYSRTDMCWMSKKFINPKMLKCSQVYMWITVHYQYHG